MPDPASASTEHVLTIDERHESGGLYLGEDATGQSISLSISTTTPALLHLIDANGDVLQESSVVAGGDHHKPGAEHGGSLSHADHAAAGDGGG